jgi:hypothetical protein
LSFKDPLKPRPALTVQLIPFLWSGIVSSWWMIDQCTATDLPISGGCPPDSPSAHPSLMYVKCDNLESIDFEYNQAFFRFLSYKVTSATAISLFY